ncbi:hypothetical protein [Tenacibaculum xiamenense]|uniref:hypothetical protein n=1 Tax=Tenacibaculum xiamenense TaxID=1261553 RepID=UPI003893EB3E
MKINLDKVHKLHANKMGVTFLDKDEEDIDYIEKQINLLFHNTILIFNNFELNLFLDEVEDLIVNNTAGINKYSQYYKSIILETPIYQLRYVVSYNDLLLIEDLIKGTIFQIELSGFLKEILQ